MTSASRNLVAALWLGAVASLSVPVAVSAQAGGAPTQADVVRLVTGNRTDLTFNFVRIGAPHRASVREASYFETDLGQAIWPVRVSYTATNGMYVRDTVASYVAFHSRQRGGAWDLSSGDFQPGDKLNVLRP